MLKRVVSLVVLVAMLNLSCTHSVKLSHEELHKAKTEIQKVALTNGTVLTFVGPGGIHFQNEKLIRGAVEFEEVIGESGSTHNKKPIIRKETRSVTIGTDSVLQVWIQKTDATGTFVAILIVTAVVAAIVVAIATSSDDDNTPPPASDGGGTTSCPFIYAWDGERFVFNAEPLGGSVCRGLQRTDYSRMESATAVDGQYRICVRNENPEVQYLDQLQMLVVDHQPGETVVPDTGGRMHIISNAVPPARAVDESGRDLSPFVSASDGLAWQTHMADGRVLNEPDTRHHLTFTYPKPVNARKARLVVNAGTAAWGSMMVKEMLDLRGSSVDQWYAAMSSDRYAPLQLLLFNLREELYLLKLFVDKGGVPVERSLIFGGGPFAVEDRVIEFDVSDIPGDSLTITLNPPKGYWAIDYLAVEYDRDAVAEAQYATVVSARNQVGQDVAGQLASVDGSYYQMPTTDDWAEMRFTAPPPTDGTERAVFVRTTGYYELLLDKSQPERQELVNRLLREPGAIGRYSLDRWQEVRQQANR